MELSGNFETIIFPSCFYRHYINLNDVHECTDHRPRYLRLLPFRNDPKITSRSRLQTYVPTSTTMGKHVLYEKFIRIIPIINIIKDQR